MIYKFGKQVHLQDFTQIRLIKQGLVTMVAKATKLGRMITYLDGLLLVKTRKPLITWSCKIA